MEKDVILSSLHTKKENPFFGKGLKRIITKPLQQLVLAGSIALMSAGGVEGQISPIVHFYGDQALNPNVQPNVLNGGKVHFDYYGSGDADGNDTLNWADYTAMQNNVSNDRTDVNGDGVTNSLDLAIMNQFLTGQIKYLPAHFDLLQNEPERINWPQKTIAIDSTNFIPSSSIFDCTGFANQTLINFSGIEEISGTSGSPYNFGTNYGQIDSTKNARFNLPVYYTSTKSYNNVGHAINAIFVGDTITNFDDWYFFEPQGDVRVFPGDWSMNLNSYALVKRHAYSYGELDSCFGPSMIYTIDFDLYNNGQDSVSLINTSHLVRQLVPLNPTNEIIPTDTLINVGNPTDTSVTGYVSNISPGAHVFYNDSIVNLGGENKDIYRKFSWKPHHRYIDKDTPTTEKYEYPWLWLNVDSLGTQKIEVRDTEPPIITNIPNPLLINYGDSIPTSNSVVINDNSTYPLNITHTDSITQDPDNSVFGHYNYDIWKRIVASDVTGNTTDTTYLYAQIRDIEKPTITSTSPLIHDVFGTPISPGQVSATDNSGAPLTYIYSDSTTQSANQDSCNYFNYEVWTNASVEDISGNKQEILFQIADIYKPDFEITKFPGDTTVGKEFNVSYNSFNGWVEAKDSVYKTNNINVTYSPWLIENTSKKQTFDIGVHVEGECGDVKDTNFILTKDLTSNVKNLEERLITNLGPNPTNGLLNLTGNSPNYKIMNWELYDLQGRLVDYGRESLQGSYSKQIDISRASRGVYMLTLTFGDISQRVKVIKR